MFVGPISSLFASNLTWRSQLRAQYESGSFSDALKAFMGDFADATQETKDLIWQLEQYQDPAPLTWRDGQWDVHPEDLIADRNKTLAAFSAAAGSLLSDYGVDMSQPVTLVLGDNGQVVVKGEHPDKVKIEALVNGSFLLRNSVTKIFAQTEQLMAASQGRVMDAQQTKTLGDALSMSLAEADTGLVGLMKLYDLVITDSQLAASSKTGPDPLDELIRDFDASETRRLQELDRNKVRQRVENAEREAKKREAHQDDVDELVAEQNAADRARQVHPELGHRPIFI